MKLRQFFLAVCRGCGIEVNNFGGHGLLKISILGWCVSVIPNLIENKQVMKMTILGVVPLSVGCTLIQLDPTLKIHHLLLVNLVKLFLSVA